MNVSEIVDLVNGFVKLPGGGVIQETHSARIRFLGDGDSEVVLEQDDAIDAVRVKQEAYLVARICCS